MVLLSLKDGLVERIAEEGDLNEVRAWASVSKMAVSLAFGVERDWELQRFDQPVGPPGSTLANLLSHSSGLGLEEGDPVVEVGTQRIYSNYGIDLAVSSILGENTADNWLQQRVFRAFGMTSTRLEDRPSTGVVGSTNDLARFAVAWLRPDGITKATRDHLITTYARNSADSCRASVDSHRVRGGSVRRFKVTNITGWGTGPRRVLDTSARAEP